MSTENDKGPIWGIPKSNTVAIVGDPGSGKTTILLRFFSNARSKENVVKFSDKFDILIWNRNAYDNIKEKTKPSGGSEIVSDNGDENSSSSENDNNKSKINGIHCFISFESSFERICATHSGLIPHKKKNKEENKYENESKNRLYFFIDATSILSGRLEDSLRYGQLRSPEKLVPEGWCIRNLRVDHCEGEAHYQKQGQRPLLRCLFWDTEDGTLEAVERSEQLFKSGKKILPDPDEIEGEKLFFLDILSPPLADPYERVRLLKDLLAEIFSRYKSCTNRFLAIDSLSSLLEELDDRWKTQQREIFSHRRLNILNMVRWLEENGVTTLMACEAKRTDSTLRRQPLFLGTEERYLASGIVQLDYHRYRSGDLVRYFRIMKMRGANHDMRAYAYDLDQENGFAWIELLFGDTREGNIHE